MPQYRYLCEMCGHQFMDVKPMHARQDVMCPGCHSYGREEMPHPEDPSRKIKRITILMPRSVNFIRDIDSQDGRTGDAIPMPSLGENVVVSSRRQLKEERKKAREKLFRDTDGEHRVLRPFIDPGTGREYQDYVTTKTEGWDIGEIVDARELPAENDPMSVFDEGKTLKQTEAELASRLGHDADGE